MQVKVDIVQKYTGHKGAVFSALYNPKEQSLYSGGAEGYIVKWELKNDEGTLLCRVENPVWSFCISPQNDLIAGTSQGVIHVMSGTERTETRAWLAHSKGVFNIAYQNPFFYTCGGDGTIKKWDEQWNLLQTIPLCNTNIRQIIFHPITQHLFAACSDHKIYELNTQGTVLRTFHRHNNSVFGIALSKNSETLYSVGRDAQLISHNLSTHNYFAVNAHWYSIHSVDVSQCGNWLATSSMDKTIKIWEAHSLRLLKVIDLNKYNAHKNCINKVIWLDPNHLVSCSDDKTLIQFKINIQ